MLVGGHILWSSNPVVIGNTGMVGVRDLPEGDSIAVFFSSTGLASCPNIAIGSWTLLAAGELRVHRYGALA